MMAPSRNSIKAKAKFTKKPVWPKPMKQGIHRRRRFSTKFTRHFFSSPLHFFLPFCFVYACASILGSLLEPATLSGC